MDYFKYKQYEFVKANADDRKVLSVMINPEKACIFNCQICNLGQTKYQGEWHDFGPIEDSLKGLEKRIIAEKPDIVEVTAGQGDPLTNPHLGEVVDLIHKHGCAARLITNCYLLGVEGHIETSLKFEEMIAGFCFVDEDTFKLIHRPRVESQFSAAKQTESMVRFSHQYKGKFTLRVLLVKGYNDSDEQVAKLKEVVDQIKYTTLWVGTWPKFNVSDERVAEIDKIIRGK